MSAPVSPDPGVLVPVPSLSAQQRAQALTRATAARRERADVKRRLNQGSVTIGEVIADGAHDPAIARLRVVELLQSMPGVGEASAARLMNELGIARSRRVRGLGPQQTQSLVERFERS